MAKFVADAFAWIEYLEGSERGRKAGEIIEDSSNEFFTPSSTLAEVVSKFLRSKKDVRIALNAINTLSILVNINQNIAFLAGQIHFETKKKNREFGMLDSFVAATARKLGAKILTGDPDFKGFPETVFI